MSKKKSIFDIKSIISKGKELYDEYGETVLSAAKTLGKGDKQQIATTQEAAETKKKEKAAAHFDSKSIISKGKELYDEYGETVLSAAKTLGKGGKQQIAATEDVTETEKKNEVVVANNNEVESCEVQVVSKPTDLKAYRLEIEGDDSFHESLTTLEDSVSFVYNGTMTPENVQQALNALSEVATETIRYAEEQETKREEIRAMRDTAIAQVSAMRDVVQTYLEKSFDERASLFAEQFKCVDAALRSGDNEMLSISLNSINTLAASSPFKNLADLNNVQKALTDSNMEWDI